MPAPMTTEGPGPQPVNDPRPPMPSLQMQVRCLLLGRAAQRTLTVQ